MIVDRCSRCNGPKYARIDYARGVVNQPHTCEDDHPMIGGVLAVQDANDHDAPLRVLGRIVSVERTRNGFSITTQARDDDAFGYTVGDPS